MSAGLRPLLVCADDLGADAHNDAVILELLQDRRLTGASVLVDGPNARAAARAPATRALGLHLNLTQSFGQPFATRSVPAWIVAAWSGQVGRNARLRERLRAEIDRQLQRFAALTGRPLDYVDGHEHVHGLPGIAELLAERLALAGAAHVPVRSVRSQRWRGSKAAIVSWLCGSAAARPMNADFIGVYPLDASDHYAVRVRGWLGTAPAQALLVCHPGSAQGAMPHAAARVHEAAYLRSNAWPQACAAAGFEVASAVAAVT